MTIIADQIRSVLEAKADALIHRNSDALAALIHADFVYINAGGRIFDRTTYIDAYCTSGSIAFMDQQVSDFEVTQFDGFAVATLSINDKFRMGERIVSGRYRSLCVFSWSGGCWQWAAGQTMVQE
jgi:hypothetical protein